MSVSFLGFILVLLQILPGLSYGPNNHVTEVYKWTKVEHYPVIEPAFVGPYMNYIPENEGIDGMAYHPASGLMIVTFSRIRPGVPITLGAFCTAEYSPGSSPIIWEFPMQYSNELRSSDFDYVTDKDGNKIPNPLLSAASLDPIIFPDEVNGDLENFPRIITVFQVAIDEKCNRVFFVDNGQLNYYHNTTYVIQKPALVIIGLPDDGCKTRSFPIIRRVEFPDEIIAKGSYGFKDPAVDYGDSCDDIFVYMFNDLHKFLSIYDYKNNDFWTFEHESFAPVIAESFMKVDESLTAQLPLGPGAGTLGKPDENGHKMLYYFPFASTAQYAVSTKILKDKSMSEKMEYSDYFRNIGYRGCKHNALKATVDTTNNIMFYTEYESHQIRCWNISKFLTPDNIGVIYESEKFGFATKIFVDSQDDLWFLKSPLPYTDTSDRPLNPQEINTIIFRVKASDAISGTVCV